MHLALQVKRDAQSAEAAQREAEERIREQIRRETEEEVRRRLHEIRASLSAETLESLHHRAAEALAKDGVRKGSAGYGILLKLRINDILEQEHIPADVGGAREAPELVAVKP